LSRVALALSRNGAALNRAAVFLLRFVLALNKNGMDLSSATAGHGREAAFLSSGGVKLYSATAFLYRNAVFLYRVMTAPYCAGTEEFNFLVCERGLIERGRAPEAGTEGAVTMSILADPPVFFPQPKGGDVPSSAKSAGSPS